ncbi:MAG: HEAT repeat domain-containing protein [Planctomycetes bacterium]|nr:HEAT repeat domain-containing protein [Planctomycetota bacterium]
MSKFIIAFVLAFSSACAAAAPPPVSPPPQDEEKEALRRTVDELARELENARVELFLLRLRVADLEKKPDQVTRILHEEGLASTHDAIRIRAIREIGAFPAERQKPFLDDLTNCTRAAAVPVRAEAVLLLGRIPDGEAAVLETAKDPAPEVRRAAATALRSGSSPSVELLIVLMTDPVSDVRLAALDSAGLIRTDRVVEAILRAAVEDSETAVIEKAIDILGNLSATIAVEPLQQLLSRTTNDRVRWSAISALGKIGKPEAAPAIRPFLERDQPPNLREVAAQALGKLHDGPSIPALTQVLTEDPESRVRVAAAAALGQIGDAATLRDILLPMALNEPEPSVQKASWEAALSTAGDDFEHLHLLSITMSEHGRRTEVEAVCKRLHTLKPAGSARETWLKLEERVAAELIEIRDFRGALSHLQTAHAAQPGRAELLRTIAHCHRELGEHDAAQKALAEALAATDSGSDAWWQLKVEFVRMLQDAGAHARVVEEAVTAVNGKQAPPDIQAAIEDAGNLAKRTLIAGLCSSDEAARKRALEAAVPLGKKIIGALANALADASIPNRTGVLEAGNAITGSAHTDLAKAPEIAAEWRAWAQR